MSPSGGRPIDSDSVLFRSMLFILWSLVAYTSAFAACARPTSTASPPAGAVSVSPNGTISGTYATFTDALKVLKLKLSAPDPVECPTVFVYTGCYEEQILIDVPNVRVIGQTKGSVKPGLSYTDNRVTLYFHAGTSIKSNSGTLAIGNPRLIMTQDSTFGIQRSLNMGTHTWVL